MLIPLDFPMSGARIADLMVTAIEGGVNHWCVGIYLKSEAPPRREEEKSTIWYARSSVWDSEFLIEVHELIDESRDASPDNVKVHLIGPAEFKAGIAKLAKEYPRHFNDILIENEDADTADAFLQMITLKELVYG